MQNSHGATFSSIRIAIYSPSPTKISNLNRKLNNYIIVGPKYTQELFNNIYSVGVEGNNDRITRFECS